MVRLKGPCMSIDASGTLAGAIVFSNWKGRSLARRHAVPANPRSGGQLSVRAMMQFLSQQWANLTSDQQAGWETRAAVTNISAFNAFIAYNMARWGVGDSPSKLDPATETGGPGSLTNHAATAQTRAIEVETECDTVADMWGINVYRSLTTGLTGARNQLVHTILAGDLATYTWLDFPLTPGIAQFYKFRQFTDDGVLGAVSAEITATPTA